MNVKSGPMTCSKCGKEAPSGFKIQGQTGPVCPECLTSYAAQQGTDKTVTLDGVYDAS